MVFNRSGLHTQLHVAGGNAESKGQGMRNVAVAVVLAGLLLPSLVPAPALVERHDRAPRVAKVGPAQRTLPGAGASGRQNLTDHPARRQPQKPSAVAHDRSQPGVTQTVPSALDADPGRSRPDHGGSRFNRRQPGHGNSRTVTFSGYRVEVPRSWPVYRLANDPTRCVRMDRHAVYLGRPAVAQRCPANAVGRTAALLIQPLEKPLPDDAVILPPNRARPGSLAKAVSEEVQIAVTGARVLITATYGASRKKVARILSSAALTHAPEPARAIHQLRPGGVKGNGHHGGSGKEWHGKGFDTCSAPSRRQMRAWRRDSPYRAVGIYIGGANRACANSHLSASWVNKTSGMGWHLLPIYVGRQAPCNTYTHTINPLFPARQGRAAARNAVNEARELGIGTRNPIYFDMEAYNSAISPCRRAVLRFLSAWTKQLHRLGYISGVYTAPPARATRSRTPR